MKILKVLFIFSLALAFASCQKEPDTIPSENTDFYMTAKIGSEAFTADSAPLVSALTSQTDLFTINGIDKDGFKIGINIKGQPSVATFLTGDKVEGNSISYSEGANFWISTTNMGSGSIVITEVTDTFIKGTFSFTGVNALEKSEKIVHDGKFKAKKL